MKEEEEEGIGERAGREGVLKASCEINSKCFSISLLENSDLNATQQ